MMVQSLILRYCIVLGEKCDWREDLRLRCARLRDHTISHQFRDPPPPPPDVNASLLPQISIQHLVVWSFWVLRESGMVASDDSWWDCIPSKLARVLLLHHLHGVHSPTNKTCYYTNDSSGAFLVTIVIEYMRSMPQLLHRLISVQPVAWV